MPFLFFRGRPFGSFLMSTHGSDRSNTTAAQNETESTSRSFLRIPFASSNRKYLRAHNQVAPVMYMLDAAYPILNVIQWAIIVSLFVVSGIAWSFDLWIIPIIKLNKSNSSIAQLEETSKRGGSWLEPINASLAFLLGINSVALSQHPDPAKAGDWKYYALSSFTLLQVAWWERVMIFPLEATITAMKTLKGNPGSEGQSWMDDRTQLSLHQALDKWSRWHAVRAALPLLAALISLSAKIRGSL